MVNEKEKKDAKEQKPVKKEEAPAEIGVTVYGPDVAKVVPGKVYTFSAEVSCAVEGYDIVWSVYCSDETVKASIVDGELYVTENPTGEDQVVNLRSCKTGRAVTIIVPAERVAAAVIDEA